MATIQIPPPPVPREPVIEAVPALVVQLQDELTSARLREACWISLVLHLLLIIGIFTSPKWASRIFPTPIPVHTAEELLQDKELTYVDLQPDRQKVEKAPKTDKISDKNRIAANRRPVLDRKVMDQLREWRRPAPQMAGGAPPMPQMQPQSPAQAPASPMQTQPQLQARQEQPRVSNKSVFNSAMSPGQAIQQAARAGGAGGSMGSMMAPDNHSPQHINSDMDILSDTMGVDFGPYLSRVRHDIQLNWENLTPEVAYLGKKGKVAITFVIMKDGSVQGLRITSTSSDVALDRAAYGGISASNPFPPLPKDFAGQYLELRCHFYYNEAE